MSLSTSPSTAVRAVVAVLAIAAGEAVSAQQLPPNFLLNWDASNDQDEPTSFNWTTRGEVHSGANGGWVYTGEYLSPINRWKLEWNCAFNGGQEGVAVGGPAVVTANIVIANNDIINQDFVLLMTLPVARTIVSPQMRGSIVGTVTDLTGDNATVFAPVGAQIFTPRIDGVDEATGYLLSDPFSQDAGGPFLSAVVGPASFGTPLTLPASQDVNATIAIQLKFTLTPGDTASFTSIFEVLPIPGPGGLAVLMALAARRRRRTQGP